MVVWASWMRGRSTCTRESDGACGGGGDGGGGVAAVLVEGVEGAAIMVACLSYEACACVCGARQRMRLRED